MRSLNNSRMHVTCWTFAFSNLQNLRLCRINIRTNVMLLRSFCIKSIKPSDLKTDKHYFFNFWPKENESLFLCSSHPTVDTVIRVR